jgi:hypothetical protein
MICSALWGGIWSEPQLIELGSSPLLVTDNQGTCWCVFNRKYYAYDSNLSAWKLETQSPFGGTLCFDKGDTLWVTQMYLYEGIKYIRYDGDSWSSEAIVPTYSTVDGNSMTTADSVDGVWVAWTTPWFGYQAVGYTRYLNGSWGEPQILTDTMEEVDHIGSSITTDDLGRIWIGWREIDWEKMPDTIIHHIKAKYWDGETWSDEILIATHDWLWATGPSLTPDRLGGMWSLWWHEPEDAAPVLLLTKYWDGEKWSPVDTIAEGGNHDLCFPWGEMAVDADNNVWVVWRQALNPTDNTGDIYYSVNVDGVWSEPQPVNEDSATDVAPRIAIDAEGRIWCVWSSGRGGEGGIWASYTWGVGVEENDIEVPPSIISVEPPIGSQFLFYTSSGVTSESLDIYDAGGCLVRSLSIERGTVLWDSSDHQGRMLPLGVYFVRYQGITAGLKKIVLIR